MDYTLRQLRLFHAEALRAEAEQRAQHLEDLLLATGGVDTARAVAALRRG